MFLLYCFCFSFDCPSSLSLCVCFAAVSMLSTSTARGMLLISNSVPLRQVLLSPLLVSFARLLSVVSTVSVSCYCPLSRVCSRVFSPPLSSPLCYCLPLLFTCSRPLFLFGPLLYHPLLCYTFLQNDHVLKRTARPVCDSTALLLCTILYATLYTTTLPPLFATSYLSPSLRRHTNRSSLHLHRFPTTKHIDTVALVFTLLFCLLNLSILPTSSANRHGQVRYPPCTRRRSHVFHLCKTSYITANIIYS